MNAVNLRQRIQERGRESRSDLASYNCINIVYIINYAFFSVIVPILFTKRIISWPVFQLFLSFCRTPLSRPPMRMAAQWYLRQWLVVRRVHPWSIHLLSTLMRVYILLDMIQNQRMYVWSEIECNFHDCFISLVHPWVATPLRLLLRQRLPQNWIP